MQTRYYSANKAVRVTLMWCANPRRLQKGGGTGNSQLSLRASQPYSIYVFHLR